jgi:hypothetical protein
MSPVDTTQHRTMTFDVKATWHDMPPPVYRIYVDNDLITERDFVWPGHEIYIKENLVCDLKPGTHVLRVENASKHGEFKLNRLRIDNVEQPKQPGKDGYDLKQWTFVCDLKMN